MSRHLAGPPASARTESLIARWLFWAGLVSVGLMFLGLVLHVLEQHGVIDLVSTGSPAGSPPAEWFLSLPAIGRGLFRRRPLALTALGTLGLMLTPVVSVALAVPIFVSAGDSRYAWIAGMVLALLGVSLAFGLAHP
jgi:uncharacterized membrane protein